MKVEVVNYTLPNGRQNRVKYDLPDDIANLAVGMRLSSETLTTGELVFYGRLDYEEEENELIEFAGQHEPDQDLIVLIKKVDHRRKSNNKRLWQMRNSARWQDTSP